ncbi:phage tail tip fiber protein [Providencia manganoxydans]|uniref:phage tail tip fiber protein n=1 Tax=Providencia manganoxydans TaxID=2923283 RepID=UPI0032D9BE17
MPELTLKISVDSTDLDKLEAQLKRIKELMVSAGLKQQASVGFNTDVFLITNGQVFLNEACIAKGTVTSAKINGVKVTREDKQREENVFRGDIKVEPECSVTLPNVVASIQEAAELINKSQSEYEETVKRIDQQFCELQSQITNIQCSSAASEQSTAQHLSGLQRQISELGKEIEEAKLKGSLNAISIISIKQTMEQQEKSLAETIKRMIAEDLCRSGTLSRML